MIAANIPNAPKESLSDTTNINHGTEIFQTGTIETRAVTITEVRAEIIAGVRVETTIELNRETTGFKAATTIEARAEMNDEPTAEPITELRAEITDFKAVTTVLEKPTENIPREKIINFNQKTGLIRRKNRNLGLMINYRK